jgi:hypothetical protein
VDTTLCSTAAAFAASRADAPAFVALTFAEAAEEAALCAEAEAVVEEAAAAAAAACAMVVFGSVV